MVSLIALSLLLAAQAPAPANAGTAGCAPRVMRLKADDAGKVLVTVTVGWKTKQAAVEGNRDGTSISIMGVSSVDKTVELGDLKDLTIATAAGAKVALKDARQKLAGGAIVVVSGDGKAVSAEFLKVFKDDTLILVSPELVDVRVGDSLRISPLSSPAWR